MERMFANKNPLGSSKLFAGLESFDVLCPLCSERYLRQFPKFFSCDCGLHFPLKDTVSFVLQHGVYLVSPERIRFSFRSCGSLN
mgnify:CR=1 FL=1